MNKRIGISFFIITMIVVLIVFLNIPKHGEISGELNIGVNSSNQEYVLKLVEEFQEKNKRIKVKVDSVSKFSSKGITPDIVFDSVDNIGKNESELKNYDTSLINVFKNNFTTGRLQEQIINGEIYGIPFTSNPLALYIRQDLVEQYGYNVDEINTWQELVDIGIDIFNKTNGQVRLFTKGDIENIKYILNSICTDKDNKDISSSISELINSELISYYGDDNYLFRITSNNIIKENENNLKWYVTYPPAVKRGGNRFFQNGGDCILVYKYKKSNEEILRRFISFCISGSKVVDDLFLSGDIFPAAMSRYENKQLEVQIENFSGESIFVVLTNIAKKAPEIINNN